MVKPLVSVAMATYNGEAFLREQLDSVLLQTWDNIEICVSDDRSTDRTYSILESYAAQIAKVRVRQNPFNVGFQKNFEFAVGMCTGEYVALCDQDDVWFPTKVERLVERIGDNQLVASDAILVDEHLRELGAVLSDVLEVGNGPIGVTKLLVHNRYAGCTMLMKGDFARAMVPFPSILPHDTWLALAATEIGGVVFEPMPLTMYRQHSRNALGIRHAKAKPKSAPAPMGVERKSEYHRRRVNGYREIRELLLMHGLLGREAARSIDRLIRYHHGYLHKRFRFTGPADSLWISRNSVQRLSFSRTLGKAVKAFIGEGSFTAGSIDERSSLSSDAKRTPVSGVVE